MLEVNDLWDFENTTVKPPTNDTSLAIHNKKVVHDKRLILDAMKDHIIPHLLGKKTSRGTWEAMTKLY